MFARGCSYVNSRKLSTVFDNAVAPVAPVEPLLFLYPRWFTSTIRQQTTVSPAKVHSRDRERYASRRCFHPPPLSVTKVSSRALSSAERKAAAPANVCLSSPVLRAPETEFGAEEQKNDNGNMHIGSTENRGTSPAAVRVPSTSPSVSSTTSPWSPLIDRLIDEALASNMLSSVRRPENMPRPLPSIPEQKSAPRLKFRDKALLLVRRLSGREQVKMSYRRHVNLWRHGNGVRIPPVHWTNIMDLLDRLEGETHVWSKSIKHRIIHVPEETIVLLSGMVGLQENIWYIFIHNGCRIRVLDAAESEGCSRKVILSGTQRAIELVEEVIVQIRDRQTRNDPSMDLKKPPVPIIPSVVALQLRGLPVPKIRGVWGEPTALGTLSASDAPPSPEDLNVRRFTEYIENLVNSLPSSRTQRERVSYKQRIKGRIEGVFSKEANQRFISTNALNMALSFLCRHEFLRSARMILSKSEAVASANTYNILLQSVAKRQDLWMFRHILSSMSRFHVRPNGQTWAAFIQCLVPSDVKEAVMQHMMDKGHLNQRWILDDALKQNISNMMSQHLSSGRDIPSFLMSMEAKFNTGLRSTLSLNLMLEEAVVRKDFDALRQIVECFKDHQLSVNCRTFNQIFRFFNADARKALLFLFRYIRLPRYAFDGSNFEKLFLAAFKNRCLNLCRVLWRYSCMEGLTSWKMRQCVKTSLKWNMSRPKANASYDAWLRSAGKVIVGLEYHQPGIEPCSKIRRMVPHGFGDDPITYLIEPSPDTETRDSQRTLADFLVHREVQLRHHLQPAEPLEIMLDAALVLDTEWKLMSLSTLGMMEHAIHVPVLPKRDHLTSRFSQIPDG